MGLSNKLKKLSPWELWIKIGYIF